MAVPFQLYQPPRQTQGISPGCTWLRPPIDGSLTTPQLYDWHYENNSYHNVFVFADHEGDPLKNLPFSQVVPAAHRAARFFANAINLDLNGDPNTFPTVAIIAKLDHVTYFTSILGLMRAGIPVFPISARHSADKIQHLITMAKPSHIFTGEEADVHALLQEVTGNLAAAHGHTAVIAQAPKYEELYLDNVEHNPLPERVYHYSAPMVITNSSGSTGKFPKPINWNAKMILQTGMSICYGERDMCGTVVSLHSGPLAVFDHVAINFISWLAFSGLILSNFRPVSPVPERTPEDVFKEVSILQPDYILLSPTMVEFWSLDVKKVSFLAGLKAVMYGGSSINPSIGEGLVRQGISLLTTYGISEVGVIVTLWPENPGLDFEYFKINGQCDYELRSCGDGIVELVAVAGPKQDLAVAPNTISQDGRPALATGDLFAPHPTKANYWKLVGRANDIITLKTGEKIHARALEHIIKLSDLRIEGALLFGENRDCLGILIDLKQPYKFEVDNEEELQRFRDSFEPSLQLMNGQAPPYARLSKERIIFSLPSKPLLYTNKGPPNRVLNIPTYAHEIDSLYTGNGLKLELI